MAASPTEITLGDNYYGVQFGQNFGQVYLAPEQPETPPEPSSNVPFRRDPHFVERATLTDQIREKLSAPAGRAALVGFGGGGKSQLAIEYARQLRQQSPQTWVLWIHASNASRFEQSVRDVTDQLKLYGRKDPKADHLQLLRNWLRDESKGSWLIVLDNVDDASFLLKPPATSGKAQVAQRRIDHIPSCDYGSIIITTRSKTEALTLEFYEEDILTVLPMSEMEAEALLESRLGQPSVDNRQLVRALECIPLAITQAAAYIRERKPRCSVQQYREEIEQSRKSRTNLLRRHIPLPNRDKDASNSVLLTWQISFEHIYNIQGSAAELLSVMSFCDRLAIPEILLRIAIEKANSSKDISNFEDDIITLRSFSLISETADPQTWEMHRLVQDATQVWLEDRRRFDEVLSRYIHCLFKSFPTGNFENWSLCHTLFPHVVGTAQYNPKSASAQLEWASVMYNSAWYALEQGEYASGLVIAVSSMTIRLEQLSEENELTLGSRVIVAIIHQKQGR